MNFLDFKVNSALKDELNTLEKQNRLPHAIIINGGSKGSREALAVFLSMWAQCPEKNAPCGKCKSCTNARAENHSDVYYAQGSGKTDIFSADEIRKITADTVIKPNEGKSKVYVFIDADKRMPVISQNTFLKTLEEPPQNALFILTTENCNSLLSTVLSRASVFNLPAEDDFQEEPLNLAKDIIKGILSPKETDLLFATGKLNKKQTALDVLPLVSRLLRDGLVCSCGGVCTLDGDCGRALAKRLSRARILKLIELNENAIVKINQNVNLNLLGAWLCGEYRRISWQK